MTGVVALASKRDTGKASLRNQHDIGRMERNGVEGKATNETKLKTGRKL
jgi:hypothetical protein